MMDSESCLGLIIALSSCKIIIYIYSLRGILENRARHSIIARIVEGALRSDIKSCAFTNSLVLIIWSLK